MDGHARQLGNKRNEKPQHQPPSNVRIQRCIPKFKIVERNDSGSLVVEVHQRQNREQHQQAANLGEQKKLSRRVGAILVSPYRDQEIHGNEHHFPEKEE